MRKRKYLKEKIMDEINMVCQFARRDETEYAAEQIIKIVRNELNKFWRTN